MAKLTYDENGEVVDYLAERNEEIKANLAEVLEMFKEKEAANKNGKKNYGFMFSMQINNELNKYPKMAVEKFANLDADDISYYWNSYYDLMCYYNQFFEIVPNRQTFLRYIGLNARQYQQLQESEDEDIRSDFSLKREFARYIIFQPPMNCVICPSSIPMLFKTAQAIFIHTNCAWQSSSSIAASIVLIIRVCSFRESWLKDFGITAFISFSSFLFVDIFG